MRCGLAIMNDFPPGTVAADRVAALREQVRFAAESGFSSVWMLQHYLGNMPTLQPLPTLAALSGDAGGMEVGTNMFILPLRHPVEVAESFSTLDHLTGGRAVAGFGMGYRENEFAAFGVPMDERVDRFTESVGLVRALWSGERVHHAGKHFRLDGERISLPPVRPGGPRVWVGAGAHKTGARRAATLGDGWIVPPHVAPDRLRRMLATVREVRGDRPFEVVLRRELVLDHDPERARHIGLTARGALTRAYGAYNAPDKTEAYRHLGGDAAATDVADESYLFTDPATAVAELNALAGLGVNRVILRAQWYDLPQEQVLRTLDLFRTEVLPHLGADA